MLISNQLDALYNGVNQQSAEHRLPTQVEEMINAYPTLDQGLRKRNPSTKVELSQPATFNPEIWTYAYDRGLIGGDEEKYSINISDGNLEIINVLSGKVYNEIDGLTFEGTSKEYLFPFGGRNGYAATTVKDTTFITNKSIIPKIKEEDDFGTGVDLHEARIQMLSNTTIGWFGNAITRSAPRKCQGTNPTTPFYDGVTTINVDGIVTVVASIHPGKCGSWFVLSNLITYSSFVSNMVSKLSSALPNAEYIVEMSSDRKIHIKRKDGNNIVVSVTIKGTLKTGGADIIIPTADFVGAIDYGIVSVIPKTVDEDYLYKSYIWIEAANPSAKYTYTATVTDEAGNSLSKSASETTTTLAATSLAAAIDLDANFSASAIGSVVEITGLNKILTCDASDTYGDQASRGWVTDVQYTTDLPKNMGFNSAIAKVIGSGNNTFSVFWLKYEASSWKETKQPDYDAELNSKTMPHILIRNDDDTFTLREYEKWRNLEFGDDISNPIPSFIDSDENVTPKIKDIFFFKNRLGFITDRSVIMSEVGEYGNFWRTTAAAVLDSDYIDATVDTNEVISLEFATYLEDSVMLFSDKAQFKLSAGKILSPKEVQISKTSAYEVNTSVRPIFMNDKIFFLSRRGNHTAVMQYEIQRTGTASEAIDISAHIQTYIPRDIIMLSGSSVNNMLFLTSENENDTVFVYKYFDNGGDRIQSAWFKWTFNGRIYSGFSLGRNFNMLIERKESIEATDWVIGTGIWDMSKKWDNSKLWVMSPDSLTKKNQLETIPITPLPYEGEFLDDSSDDNATIIPTYINLGEWVYSNDGEKDIRGHLKFKTVQISSEDGSQFKLQIDDTNRNTSRYIDAKYTVGRKPMVYGDAKNIKVIIKNDVPEGFRINTVSFEGALTKRDRKI